MSSPDTRVGILPRSIKLLVKVIKVSKASPRILNRGSIMRSWSNQRKDQCYISITHHSSVRIFLAVTSQQAFIRELEDGHLDSEVYTKVDASEVYYQVLP